MVDGIGLGASGELTSAAPGELTPVTVERAAGRPWQTTTLPPNGMAAPVGGGQDFHFVKIP